MTPIDTHHPAVTSKTTGPGLGRGLLIGALALVIACPMSGCGGGDKPPEFDPSKYSGIAGGADGGTGATKRETKRGKGPGVDSGDTERGEN